jgi:hypothetical protein
MGGVTHVLANRGIKLKYANIRGVNSQINHYQKPGADRWKYNPRLEDREKYVCHQPSTWICSKS